MPSLSRGGMQEKIINLKVIVYIIGQIKTNLFAGVIPQTCSIYKN
jgi:hypothetical protein